MNGICSPSMLQGRDNYMCDKKILGISGSGRVGLMDCLSGVRGCPDARGGSREAKACNLVSVFSKSNDSEDIF